MNDIGTTFIKITPPYGAYIVCMCLALDSMVIKDKSQMKIKVEIFIL